MRFHEIIEASESGSTKAIKDQQAAARQNEKIQASRAAVRSAFVKCQNKQQSAAKEGKPEKAAEAKGAYQNAVQRAHSSEQKARTKLAALTQT